MKNKLFIITIILSMFLTTGFGCAKIDKTTMSYYRPVTLEYWRVWDDSGDFQQIIDNYKRIHPNVTINYKKFRYEEYKQKLLEGFAYDRGPDIFSIHNTWTREYQNKNLIGPMPTKITLAYPYVKGNLKKELAINLKSTNMPTPTSIEKSFLDVVYDDIIIKTKNKKGVLSEKIYGLPLSVDTLVMFYNKDLLNNAGIINAPEYWDKEFQQNVKKLTKQDNKGQILQSGVALGGSDNIERYSDILALLMMQNGTNMLSDNGQVQFHAMPGGDFRGAAIPGYDALRFYTDFANPAKEVYSWNSTIKNSLELFTQNKLAIMFGYSYMIPQIKSLAPKLNFAITKIPQIKDNPPVNFANYWVESVSNKILTDRDNIKAGGNYTQLKYNYAWDFIQFATKESQVQSYLDSTGKPTALKSMIKKQQEDRELNVFADQLLTAKSWYKGNDSNATEIIIKDLIDKIVSGESDIPKGINLAAQKVQQTINK